MRGGHTSASTDSPKRPSSVQGSFGEMPVNARTQQTPMRISPLSALCWYFHLDAVAAAKPYLVELRETDTVDQASQIIDGYNDAHRTRAEPIPI